VKFFNQVILLLDWLSAMASNNQLIIILVKPYINTLLVVFTRQLINSIADTTPNKVKYLAGIS